MRGAAATLRRRARPGGRKESAMPTPGNGTGKGRGCGPRAGVCAHYTDGKGEGLRAQPRAGAGGGWRWAALCRGEVHTRRLTPPRSPPPSGRPSGAEARQRVPRSQAAAFSRAPAQVRALSQWGPPRGDAEDDCATDWGKPKPALPRGDAPVRRLALQPHFTGGETELEGGERQWGLGCGSGVSGRLTVTVNV